MEAAQHVAGSTEAEGVGSLAAAMAQVEAEEEPEMGSQGVAMEAA